MAEISHDMLCTYYDNGVRDGEYSGRMKGMEEYKDALLYYMNMTVQDQYRLFGTNSMYTNLDAHSPNEFIEKINQYKDLYEQKLRVGDYVKDCSNNLCVITNIDTSIHVVYPNGKTHKWKKNSRFTRLGYPAPIMIDALKIMKENQEMT